MAMLFLNEEEIMEPIKAGATSNILQVRLLDSSSTTGGGLTGLAFNTASLIAYYHRDTDTTATAITLVTMTVGTFTSSGFKEIDSTHQPGLYQFCPPDAAFAAGAKRVTFQIQGAANLAQKTFTVPLVAYDPQTATNLGLSALPTASPASNGGLPTVNASNGVTLATNQLFVKKNTSLTAFPFLMRSSTDHITPVTGLTITSQCSIDGAAFASTTNSATEIGSGMYKINLAAADTNGTVITYKFTGSGADATYITVVTQS